MPSNGKVVTGLAAAVLIIGVGASGLVASKQAHVRTHTHSSSADAKSLFSDNITIA
jgi:D-arabinose 5-phosphate isomerase GutQ